MLTTSITLSAVELYVPRSLPALVFAADDIVKALRSQKIDVSTHPLSAWSTREAEVKIVLIPMDDPRLNAIHLPADLPRLDVPESFAIRRIHSGRQTTILACGKDTTGTMYAGLELAETISLHGLQGVSDVTQAPYIAKRGLKMNIPLDARLPAYADGGDAAQKNIPHVWDVEFWHEYLDTMARHRYNVLSLWNAHPFPALVKVPEYPEVAIDDVKIADIDWRSWLPRNAGRGGARGVTPDILANLKTVKKMRIDEKIAFWRHIMEYAHQRGIEIYIITWNIFTWAAEGKYGIDTSPNNPVTIDYIRKSVRTLFETYPLLAGIGVTAGEHMPHMTPEEKETWLWKTYGQGVMDARKREPHRKIRFIHRHWMSRIQNIIKHFHNLDSGVEFDFSFKYAKARLYSYTAPHFVDKVLKQAPPELKWWWNLRNDDIFYFRWGDPDFVRSYILNFPKERTRGYYMGSDGYVWGREFVSTEPDTPRQLELHKHWFRFMLWGRLGYNPQLSNRFFIQVLQHRFPDKPAEKLFHVWRIASKIIPAINRAHWHDWDFQWSPETCQGRKGYHSIAQRCWKNSSPAKAEELRRFADTVLEQLSTIKSIPGDKEWRRTLGDCEAMAHLGRYYAAKLQAAAIIRTNPARALEYLKEAYNHWLKYAQIGKRQYQSQLFSKVGWFDWDESCENAHRDILLCERLLNLKTQP